MIIPAGAAPRHPPLGLPARASRPAGSLHKGFLDAEVADLPLGGHHGLEFLLPLRIQRSGQGILTGVHHFHGFGIFGLPGVAGGDVAVIDIFEHFSHGLILLCQQARIPANREESYPQLKDSIRTPPVRLCGHTGGIIMIIEFALAAAVRGGFFLSPAPLFRSAFPWWAKPSRSLRRGRCPSVSFASPG